MSVNKVVSLVGEFQVGGQMVQNLELKTSETKIRFNEVEGTVVVLGQNPQGQMVKGFAHAAEGLLQQLDHLGPRIAAKDQSLRVPKQRLLHKMPMEPVNEAQAETYVQMRGAQSIDVFSLVIAAAAAFHLLAPASVIEMRDDFRRNVTTYLKDQFKAQPPAVKVTAVSDNCPLVPISHSPSAMMIMAQKFPDAGCPAPQKK